MAALRRASRCCTRAWAHFLKTSAAMGTVELTGLEMMATQASGQYLATPSHRVFTMPMLQGMGMSQGKLHLRSAPPLHRRVLASVKASCMFACPRLLFFFCRASSQGETLPHTVATQWLQNACSSGRVLQKRVWGCKLQDA